MTLDLLTKVIEHHAPVRKRIVKLHPGPWTDNELSKAFMERSKAKVWQNYKKLKLNRKKKASLYKNAFSDCKSDSLNTWNFTEGLFGTSVSPLPSNIDVDGYILKMILQTF